MKRVALVMPWFGDLPGPGGELGWRQLAQQLTAEHDVTVLTTCAHSAVGEWDANYFAPGIERQGALGVRRFPVAPRQSAAFENADRALRDTPRERWIDLREAVADTAAFIDESINSVDLENYLAHEAPAAHDAVIFVGYRYGVVVRGVAAYPGPAHVLPYLRDEVYARLPAIEHLMCRAATLLVGSAAEAELALGLYGPGVLAKLHVIGTAVELAGEALPALPAGIRQPYAVALGVRDPDDGLDEVIAGYHQFGSTRPAPLGLVLAGPGDASFDDTAAGIVDLGWIDEGLVSTVIAESVGLIEATPNEGPLHALLEAWRREKPVAVSAQRGATARLVREIGGGYTATDWADVFTALAVPDATERAARAAAGAAYARDNADWRGLIDRLRRALGFVEAPPTHARGLRIDQFVQTLEYGDAISDYALRIQAHLRAAGFASTVYAENIGSRVAERAVRVDVAGLAAADAIIYHHSISSLATASIVAAPGRKALVYHNITPAAFFRPYDDAFATKLDEGRRQTRALIGAFDAYIADSDFNAQELREMGAASVRTVPVSVDFSRFDRIADRIVFARRAGVTNVVFVGRVSPSKGIHRLLDVFEAYLCFDSSAHLTIIGRYEPADHYYAYVRAVIAQRYLDRSVTLTGTVEESTLLAYYRLADLYVSMSEHEGFCVPVVEAMFFDVPVVALGVTAIPETLGEGGLLVAPETDPIEVAALMHALQTDADLRASVLAAQRRRRVDFSPAAAERHIDALIAEVLR